MRPRLAACAPLLLALLPGCERIDAPASAPTQEVLVVAPPEALPPFARGDARLRVAHTGLRRLEFAPVAGSGLVFRERITTDGQGRYAIVPEALLESSSLEWDGFELLQRAREGFLYRYRDFLVRDAALFARNWKTTELAQPATVAGRACLRYRIERRVGTPIAFELWVDSETDLVLASEEFDAAGERIASMEYETFALDPDLASVVWHTAANQELPLDARADVQSQLELPVLQPRLLPAGYALLEAATVRHDPATLWLKLTYSDGIEPLFFFQTLQAPERGRAARIDGSRAGRVPDATSGVVVYQVGAATAIQGQVDGHELMVVGQAPQSELLDLIESALP